MFFELSVNTGLHHLGIPKTGAVMTGQPVMAVGIFLRIGLCLPVGTARPYKAMPTARHYFLSILLPFSGVESPATPDRLTITYADLCPPRCACALPCGGIPSHSNQMRNFVIGIVVGAALAVAVVDHVTSRSALVPQGELRSHSVKSTPAPICGRDTFNILVDVRRFQAVNEAEQKVLAAEIQPRLDRLADEVQARLERAGLHHDLTCPVILNVFGWLMQDSPVRWTVVASVELHATDRASMTFPSWDSGLYKVWWASRTVAQDDLEKALFERVQRFLMYFGKQGGAS